VSLLLSILGRVPRPVLSGLGSALAWLAWTLRIRRRVVLSNLRLAFPEKPEAERLAIARATYRNLGQLVPDFVRVPWLTGEELDRLFVTEGFEALEVARAAGGGVVACTAHLGNFEVLAAAQTRRGIPVTMISREMGGAGAASLWRAVRERSGVQDLVVKKGETMRAARDALRAGRNLGYVIDQNVHPRHAIFPTFFGVPAATAATPAYLAHRYGAQVVFVVTVPLGDGRHLVSMEGPIPYVDTGHRERDVLAFMQGLNDRLERWVRRHPEHWYWLHRRWKTRPPGEVGGPRRLVDGPGGAR
jgi:KDO2-lipid IV(A) lauroyltransferase